MAAALAASDNAVSALNNLASTVMGIYDAVGDRAIGRSDLLFHIEDWSSFMRFAQDPIEQGLKRKETSARAVRVLELNVALANWLAGMGFKMGAARARWSRPWETRRWNQMPRFFLAKKAIKFQEKLGMVKEELGKLSDELYNLGPELRILPATMRYSEPITLEPIGDPTSEEGTPVEMIPEKPPGEIEPPSEKMPETTEVTSRLLSATQKLGG